MSLYPLMSYQRQIAHAYLELLLCKSNALHESILKGQRSGRKEILQAGQLISQAQDILAQQHFAPNLGAFQALNHFMIQYGADFGDASTLHMKLGIIQAHLLGENAPSDFYLILTTTRADLFVPNDVFHLRTALRLAEIAQKQALGQVWGLLFTQGKLVLSVSFSEGIEWLGKQITLAPFRQAFVQSQVLNRSQNDQIHSITSQELAMLSVTARGALELATQYYQRFQLDAGPVLETGGEEEKKV